MMFDSHVGNLIEIYIFKNKDDHYRPICYGSIAHTVLDCTSIMITMTMTIMMTEYSTQHSITAA